MKKEYKAVQDLLGLSAMESDSDNGYYFVEPLMEELDEKITHFNQRSKTLDAKLQEAQELNATIAQLKSDLASKDTTLAEKETAIADLNKQVEGLNQTIADLTAKGETADTTLADKDATIATLNAKVEELTNSIADKDAELAELGKRSSAQPTSTVESKDGEVVEKIVGPHNVTNSGMTLEQKAAALEARNKELLGLR